MLKAVREQGLLPGCEGFMRPSFHKRTAVRYADYWDPVLREHGLEAAEEDLDGSFVLFLLMVLII